jgi:hypothetical protein
LREAKIRYFFEKNKLFNNFYGNLISELNIFGVNPGIFNSGTSKLEVDEYCIAPREFTVLPEFELKDK